MRKVAVLVGGVIGFFVGSWAGRGPYEGLQQRLRGLRGQSDLPRTVQDLSRSASAAVQSAAAQGKGVAGSATDAARQTARDAGEAISDAGERLGEGVAGTGGRAADAVDEETDRAMRGAQHAADALGTTTADDDTPSSG